MYNFWQQRDGSLIAQRRGGTNALPPADAPDELRVAIDWDGTATVKRVPLDRRGTPLPQRARWLLSSMLVPKETALGKLLSLLERAEDCAHTLVWSQTAEEMRHDGARRGERGVEEEEDDDDEEEEEVDGGEDGGANVFDDVDHGEDDDGGEERRTRTTTSARTRSDDAAQRLRYKAARR